ncbi:hypothetical protein L198_05934 [Cryptococcus wingfieldii CBS 7118]|uniref:RING-type E3 ubiquitin transferase n=1 Tax=Cryptococcus wingfieldii CBS 7118 TaxID=1295528 RepID=A0A1E3IS37_9TREE|nr:hypothetical protein L198_05934 [Cryptococcus wingfieldii CBS 7118]ODN91420.1 hypothetical protein L198_05934 [Cryptococcus wingfieldii CBS 7118]
MESDIDPRFLDDEGDVCRVCRTGAEEDLPLVYPCKCSGSVRYVHPDCLKQWVAQSQKKHCEICGHKYTFTKVFPSELPSTIPPTVYARQALLWVRRQILFVLRMWLVIITWLVALPATNMTVLVAMNYATDHIGDSPQSLSINATTTDNSTTSSANFSSTVTSILLNPYSTAYHFGKDSYESWLKGDENTSIGYVLRGQILSLSLAAVLIGLVLLREWVQQHNWAEAEQPPRHVEPDIDPEEWFVINGVARRQSEMISRVLETLRGSNNGDNTGPFFPDTDAGHRDRAEWWANRRQWVMALPEPERTTLLAIVEVMERQHRGEIPLGDDELEDEESDDEGLHDQLQVAQNVPIPQTPQEALFADETFIPNDGNNAEGLLSFSEYIALRRVNEGKAPTTDPASSDDSSEDEIRYDNAMTAEQADQDGPSRKRKADDVGFDDEAARPRENITDALAEYRRVHTQREQAQAHDDEEQDDLLQAPFRPAWSRQASGDKAQDQRERVAYRAPELLRNQSDQDQGTAEGSGQNGYEAQPIHPQPPQPLFDGFGNDGEGDEDEDDDWEDEPDDRGRLEAGNEFDLLLDAVPQAPGPVVNGQPAALAQIPGLDLGVRVLGANGEPIHLPPGNVQVVPPQDVAFGDEEEDMWDPEDWNGILEVVGLTGPMAGLYQNFMFAFIIMGGAIVILVGLPMLIGKLCLSLDIIRSILSICGRVIHLVRKVTDPVVDIVFEIVKDVVLLPLLNSGKAAEKILAKKLGLQVSSRFGSQGLSGLPSVPSTSSPMVQKLGDHLAALGQYSYDIYESVMTFQREIGTRQTVSGRAACVGAGYGLVAEVVAVIAIAGEAGIGGVAGDMAATIKEHTNFIKVAMFMVLELVAFPLGVGFMIDLSIVPLFPGATAMSRVHALRTSPFASSFIDWIVGSMFMFSFSSLLSQVRKVTRRGTMFFIRDPGDPSFSPVKDIVEKTTMHQLKKLGTSVLMYSLVIFGMFGVFPWALSFLPGGLLPLKMEPNYPLSSIPFDLLFLHLMLPPSVDLFQPRLRAKRLFKLWWKKTTTQFRLTNFVNVAPHPDERTAPLTVAEKTLWPMWDVVCQLAFGKYDNKETMARVPASDSVVLVPVEERRVEGGVFIPLDSKGVPENPQDKLRLLKQDKLSREAGRLPMSDYGIVWLPQYWRTRIHMFLATALASISVVIASATFIPIIIGRMAWKWSGFEVHDGYSWFLGAYIAYAAYALGRQARKYINSLNRADRLRQSIFSRRVKRTVRRYCAGAFGVSMMYGLVPVLVGAVLESYLGVFFGDKHLPGRVVHFWDIWALGTAASSLLTGVILVVNRLGRFDSLSAIATQFREPAAKDFSSTASNIKTPVLVCISAIALPYAIGISSLMVLPPDVNMDENNAFLFRCVIIPISFAFLLITSFSQYLVSERETIRQKVLEAEYVLEERVENYEPGSEESSAEERNPLDAADLPPDIRLQLERYQQAVAAEPPRVLNRGDVEIEDGSDEGENWEDL